MPSVFGDGLPERLRSTALALLGLTAAAGLGLVAFALQQSWPIASSLPIPGISSESESVQDRTIASEPTPEAVAGQRRTSTSARSATRADPQKSTPSDSRLASTHRVVVSPPSAPAPDRVSPGGERSPDGDAPEPQPDSSAAVTSPSSPPGQAPAAGSSPPATSSLGAPSGDEDDDERREDDDDEDEGRDDDRDKGRDDDRDDEDEGHDDDGREHEGDNGGESEGPRKGRGRSGGRSKDSGTQSAPSPKAVKETPKSVAPTYEEEPDEDEFEEDESGGEDEHGYGRGRGHGGSRRGR